MGLEEKPAALFTSRLDRAVGSVDLVDWNVVVSRSGDAADNSLAIVPVKLLPRIRPSVPCIDITGRLVNEEETDVSVSVFSRRSKDGVVIGELDNMVEFEDVIVEFNHGTPPSNIVVIGAPTGVSSSPEVWGLLNAPINNIAANPKTTATVVLRTCGWVNLVNS